MNDKLVNAILSIRIVRIFFDYLFDINNSYSEFCISLVLAGGIICELSPYSGRFDMNYKGSRSLHKGLANISSRDARAW